MSVANNNEIVQAYISNFRTFEESLNGSRDMPFHELRRQAIACFSKLGFPTPRSEEWKYTNVAPILARQFGATQTDLEVTAAEVEELTFKGLTENVIVFVNGRFAESLSRIKITAKGIIIKSLAKALVENTDLVTAYLGRHARFETEAFTALNTAFTGDGLFIHVADNVVADETVHVVHISRPEGDGFVAHPRTLFVVGKNSRLKVVESFSGQGTGAYFNNLVGEVVVNENGNFDHVKIQDENLDAFHISSVQIHQERNSVVSTVTVDLGGALVRNNLNVLFNGPNCETHLFGFFMGRGTQLIDNHTFIDHAMPHCFSNELYKGVLDDRARGVFSGKILVRQDAQKTNALQSNKTLLLTDEAVINAKPQLEIFADDVKCTHGATIGQLDDEAMFYLRARGISAEMAGAMLRHAFISDVLANIKHDCVREKLDETIIERFTNGKMT